MDKREEVDIMYKTVWETHLYRWLEERNSEFLGQVNDAIKHAEDMLPLICKVFADYTVHGIKHSINVMEYMFSLITDIHVLSELEVVLLIYSALFHDIGMIVNEDEIKEIKADKLVLGERKYSKVFEKYKEENIALQECIRPIHGKRSKDHIENQMDETLFLLPGSSVVSFRNELGLICMAHNEDFEWIEKEISWQSRKGIFPVNAQYIAVLLRIADYLDIDEQRAPLYLYKYLNPKEFGDLEWKQHFVIENYDKIILNEKTGIKEIVFQGSSHEPAVHRKLLKYFDSINGELHNAVSLCERFDKRYMLQLRTNVVNKIQTEGFGFSDLRLSLNYNAVTNLLMGEHIYGNKKYGLRELIQNSIDACKVMQEVSLQMEEYRYQKYQPVIKIIIDKDRQQVILKDNGSGMSVEILKKYFLNVGVSYYASDDYLLQGRKYNPIGRYGIGFLACFMLSDNVGVNTVYYKDHKMTKVLLEKGSEYICLTYENMSGQHGTEIVLEYEQCMEVFGNEEKNIVAFIEQNFLDSGIAIQAFVIENGKHNSLDCVIEDAKQKISYNMCLNKYLVGIDAYIDSTYKQISFISRLDDLNGCVSCYYEDQQGLLLDSERKVISDYVRDGKICLMNVPIVFEEDEAEFLIAYEVLEDYEDALDRLAYYESVNVWTGEEGDENEIYLEAPNDVLVGMYTLEDFREQFGHASDTPLQTASYEKKVVTKGGNMVLPYEEDCAIYKNYSWERSDLCYFKNVFLLRQKVKIPYLVDGIALKGAVINITNPEVTPDVSRNDISLEEQEKLSYAIGKAVHLWIRDNVSLTPEQKDLLDLFIETKYGETNLFLK